MAYFPVIVTIDTWSSTVAMARVHTWLCTGTMYFSCGVTMGRKWSQEYMLTLYQVVVGFILVACGCVWRCM